MIKFFRGISFLEGLSYLLLLFIAVPLKHFGDMPEYVRALGLPHGLLFIAYIVLAFMVKEDKEWNMKTFGIVLAASIIPFGTFYVDKKYLK